MKEDTSIRNELMRNLAERHCEKAGRLYDIKDRRYVYGAYCAGWEAALKTIWHFASNIPDDFRWVLVRLKGDIPVVVYLRPKAWADIKDRALYWCYLDELIDKPKNLIE